MIINSVTEIFFSPTNTTRKIITAISDGMNLKNREVIDITKPESRNNNINQIKGDIVLIGVPVYEEKVPEIAAEFLRKLNGNKKPAIIVGVYGNIAEGIVLNELSNIASSTNFKVVGAATFIGEHSFSSDNAKLAQNRPNRDDLIKAEKFGQDIINLMKDIADLDHIKIEIPEGKLLLMAKVAPQNSARLVTKRPDIDKSICVNCNICVKWCPVGAINEEESLEIDEKKCLRCFSCVKRCPKKARKIVYRPNFIVSRVLSMKNKIAKEPKLYLCENVD